MLAGRVYGRPALVSWEVRAMAEVQERSFDIIVIGSGPAGVTAARRAAELGARTALVERQVLGGMATLDGPVPVRTLAHAARLVREARQLSQYGLNVPEVAVDYRRLMEGFYAVVDGARWRR